MVTKTVKLNFVAGNLKFSATKLFTCKIIYVQVERIVILLTALGENIFRIGLFLIEYEDGRGSVLVATRQRLPRL